MLVPTMGKTLCCVTNSGEGVNSSRVEKSHSKTETKRDHGAADDQDLVCGDHPAGAQGQEWDRTTREATII